ncbi:MAG: NAD+ synthase [Desulfovibrionaceae bacterium]
MRIGVLQLNPVVGDMDGNCARLEAAARQAAGQGADLCVATELGVLGYPPRDLLLYPAVVRRAARAVADLAARLADAPPLFVGGVAENPGREGRPLFNCAWLLDSGQVRGPFCKTLLPTYDVFDEDRYFEPGDTDNLVSVAGLRVAVTICEDLWNDREFWPRPRYHTDRVDRTLAAGPDLIVNLSASPFCLGKQALREAMLAKVARTARAPLLYVNQTGGDDELVFDGRSTLFGPDGALWARLPAFEESVAVLDLAPAGPVAPDDFAPEAEAWRALVAGTRDYVRKCGFSRALLGLSGGIDSALTATVAAHALGPDNVTGVLMPSPHSSPGSVSDSLDLARRLGIRTLTLPIGDLMAAFDAALAEPFAGREPDVTEENLQSRIRGGLLMALSNKFNAVLLSTGNKSELAVGYCTIYGDMNGGLAVISDLPKTLVWAVARWVNAHVAPAGLIPEAIVEKPPSAELRPGQLDQDSLPPYEVLDEILRLHIEERLCAHEIAARGQDPAVVAKVLRLVRIAEFKRRQAAPGLKITAQAFGSGWRMPIASRIA